MKAGRRLTAVDNNARKFCRARRDEFGEKALMFWGLENSEPSPDRTIPGGQYAHTEIRCILASLQLHGDGTAKEEVTWANERSETLRERLAGGRGHTATWLASAV